jgi:hypothetical protein
MAREVGHEEDIPAVRRSDKHVGPGTSR